MLVIPWKIHQQQHLVHHVQKAVHLRTKLHLYKHNNIGDFSTMLLSVMMLITAVNHLKCVRLSHCSFVTESNAFEVVHSCN